MFPRDAIGESGASHAAAISAPRLLSPWSRRHRCRAKDPRRPRRDPLQRPSTRRRARDLSFVRSATATTTSASSSDDSTPVQTGGFDKARRRRFDRKSFCKPARSVAIADGPALLRPSAMGVTPRGGLRDRRDDRRVELVGSLGKVPIATDQRDKPIVAGGEPHRQPVDSPTINQWVSRLIRSLLGCDDRDDRDAPRPMRGSRSPAGHGSRS